MADNIYETPQDFLQKLDAGDLDGNLVTETKKLTIEQLDEVAQLLILRDGGTSKLD